MHDGYKHTPEPRLGPFVTTLAADSCYMDVGLRKISYLRKWCICFQSFL